MSVSKRRRSGRRPKVCCSVERVFRTSVPEELLHIFDEKRRVALAGAHRSGRNCGSGCPPNRRFGTTRGSLSALFLNTGRNYQVAELKALSVNEQGFFGTMFAKMAVAGLSSSATAAMGLALGAIAASLSGCCWVGHCLKLPVRLKLSYYFCGYMMYMQSKIVQS
jgi:hypothetical protein